MFTSIILPLFIPLGLDQLIGSQDQKLLLVKSSVHSTGGPQKLVAGPPEVQTAISDLPSPSLPITSELNPYSDLSGFDDQGPNNDIDFTRAEDFFQLETQIDVKKDHSVVKLALTSPEGSFLNELMSNYPIPTQRLAFIQQVSNSSIRSQQNNFLVGPGQDSKELIVSCQGCGEMFSCLNKFQRHILTHPDPENKKFLCQVCGKRFNRADHLNRHSILHGNVVHKCMLCGEEFDRASHLDRHRRKNHPPAGQAPSQTPPATPQSKYPPETLSPSAIGNSSIGTNLHLLAAVATPEDTRDLTPEQILQLEASKVVSQILVSDMQTEQKTTNKKPLAEVERPFVCDVCDRKFIRSTHLRRHMRIHTGEKPFACHICGRRYARGDYLRAHIQGHRRDRVHKCKHCNEIFHDLTRFANHCRLLHQDTEEDGRGKEQNVTPEPHDISYSLSSETQVSMDAMDTVNLSDSSSPSAIVTVSSDNNHIGDAKRIEELTFTSGVPQHFANDLLHVLNPASATSTQNEANIILQNGSLAIPDASNEVSVLSGKVGQSQMLESLTQFFITGSGTFLSNDHTHT